MPNTMLVQGAHIVHTETERERHVVTCRLHILIFIYLIKAHEV